MAKRARAALRGTQLEVMQVVWARGSATVAEVHEALQARRGIARNTVQTTLTRLEAKGWLRHVREGRGFRYRPAATRTRAMQDLVSKLVHDAFSGSAEALVAALLGGHGLSEAEADRILAMVEQAEKKQR